MRTRLLRPAVWCRNSLWKVAFLVGLFLSLGAPAFAQMDQGTIAGVVQDISGAIIPGAQVTLTDLDTGLVLRSKADSSGVYVFSPLKIGNYQVSASASGFEKTTQEHLQLHLQERLNVVVKLTPGNVTETVTVTTAPPLLQTQDASSGQVVSARTINNTPLNGRNWVYIAQLTAGVTSGSAARGGGTGDFDANGQRAEQNNFILDGVDNNVNVVDFFNGASYVVRPPPDALSEFKIQTGDYSAEFGHSAGAVVNASIKSGTNQIHGDLWEYVRNDALDARNFNATSVPKYRENQFGATLGFPIVRNKLFFFGDTEANRIIYGQTLTQSVPTPLMRQGNFSELLNTSLTGASEPTQLYQPNSGGTAKLQCKGQNNVFCASQIDSVAQNLLNLYPLPNANNGKTYNNYIANFNNSDNTFQWDTRADWNISSKDQAFSRLSYTHEQIYIPPPLGPILGGGAFKGAGNINSLGENLVLSETHIFNPNFVNEFRFGYNYAHFDGLQPNSNRNIAPTLGLGGIPYDAAQNTGGLPQVIVGGMDTFGTPSSTPTNEFEDVYQILDNLTKIIGNHTLHFGGNLQSIRIATSQASPLGQYSYNGLYTSDLSATFTGYGVADFLANQMSTAKIVPLYPFNDVRWYRAAYFQDDWKVSPQLTLNLGLRYEYTQPMREIAGRQANFLTAALGPGQGYGTYFLPAQSRNIPLSSQFLSILVKDNVTLQYDNNPALVNAQKTNFAPRVGLAYQLDGKTVVRSGFGIFYGGLENRGGSTNLANNYPFTVSSTYPAPSCKAGYGNCVNNGLTLETGFPTGSVLSTPVLQGYDALSKTPYSMEYNLTVERSLSNNLIASAGYVGSVARHLQVPTTPNQPEALLNPANSIQNVRPFPDFGSGQFTAAAGDSNYNSLQTRLEKRYAGGLDFLATYTWAHSLDDAPTILTTDTIPSNTNLVPISYSYSNSIFDVRQRFTLNGFYQLPFGRGRRWMNGGRIADLVAGGWASSLTFAAQTGTPFTVTTANITGAAGITPLAQLVRDPFKAGGSPDLSNPTVTCAAKTRTLQNWYNPCAFANPLNGTAIPRSGAGSQVTDRAQVLEYMGGRRNEVPGPGYERINMSMFKDFVTYREQLLQFRVDVFNLLNTPAYGDPSTSNDSNKGGLITAPQTFQNNTPDARFFQLSAKYIF